MAKYPEIIEQLVGAAYDQGLFSGSQIFAASDGGTGLKESLENAFPGLQFILARPHLKKDIYEGVDAMDLPKNFITSVKDFLLSLIDSGQVNQVIKKLQDYQGPNAKKIENLADYLIRFRSLCSL